MSEMKNDRENLCNSLLRTSMRPYDNDIDIPSISVWFMDTQNDLVP